MDKLLTDIQFIVLHDKEIGQQYEEAKNLYIDAPIHTLVTLRAIITGVCVTIGQEHGIETIGKDLFDQISILRKERIICPDAIDLLQKLRDSGNKAAHREKFSLTTEQYINLALDSLKQFCELIQTLRLTVLGGKTLKYSFVEEIDSSINELSYRALFEDDVEAKYQVSMALLEVNRQRQTAFFESKEGDGYSFYSDKGMTHWAKELLYSAALSHHTESMFQYGGLLLSDKKKFYEGLGFLRRAAEQGHINAKAHFGYYIAHDESPDKYDIEDAKKYLESAAEAYNPIALHVLSELYQSGKFFRKDAERAVTYLKRAADAGYPESQYELAKYYRDKKKDLPLAIEHFKTALAGGHHRALLELARIARDQIEDKQDVPTVIEFYNKYLENHACAEGMFELSQLRLKHNEHSVTELKECMGLMITAYRLENCPKFLDTKIEKAAKKALDEFLAKGGVYSVGIQELPGIMASFDSQGKLIKSIKDISENLRKIADNPLAGLGMVYNPRKRKPRVPQHQRKIGRNETCPLCDSGKKYKLCCGR